MLLIIIVIGIIGYMSIEGDGFLSALYMTVITVSTVGFGEIHQLSEGGRVFTIILILMSFGTYAYAISVITTHFVEGKLSFFLKGQRQKFKKKMENHVIICGYGRNGQQAANELRLYKEPYVVIDTNHDLVVENLDLPFRFIEGDATQDEILIKADIEKAKAVVSTLPNDADNLYVVITARALNPGLTIISRASNESSQKKLRMAEVDNVVMPEKVGGAHMAKMVARPDILEFLEQISIGTDAPTNLEEIICDQLPKEFLNKTIYDIQIRKLTGANIVGFKSPDGEYILNPLPDTRIIPHSKLFVLGTTDQIKNMKKVLSGESSKSEKT